MSAFKNLNKEEKRDLFNTIRTDFIQELNAFRRDPKSILPDLKQYLNSFKENVLYRENHDPVETEEGLFAVEELIQELSSLDLSLNPIEESSYLNHSALDHALDIGSKGVASHEGSNGLNLSERIDKYCEWEGSCAENIAFACSSGKSVLIEFLVDDGISDRAHRLNLLSNDYHHIGVGVEEHKEYGNVIVVNLVYKIREKNKPFFDSEERERIQKEKENELLNKVNNNKEDKEEAPKQRVIKNDYQLDDEDAPDTTVNVKVIKRSHVYDGNKYNVTKKIYTLEDGSKTIVEVEDHNY